MDVRLQAVAEATARQLIAFFREMYPDWTTDIAPVDEMTAWLGFTVQTFHRDDYPEGTFGWLEPGEDLIWVRRDLPETFRRFTLAHELGHALLHRTPSSGSSEPLQRLAVRISRTLTLQSLPQIAEEDPCRDKDVQENVPNFSDQDRLQEILGSGQMYDPRSERELQANIFAAELLMPMERLRTLYLEEDESPVQIAGHRFQVSQAALLNRLTEMLNPPLKSHTLTIEVQPPTKVERKPYDQFQQAAIEAPTPALIVAGPGSGKTSTLIGRALFLIEEQKTPASRILALTFSRKAAEEMRERLQLALGSQRPLPVVSTFHAYCADLLRRYPEEAHLYEEFRLVDDTEGYFLLRRVYNEMLLDHYHNLKFPPYYFPMLLKAISRAKDELVTPEEYRRLADEMLKQAENDADRQEAQKAREVADVYARYEEALLKQRDIDFGGLLMRTIHLFEGHPEILAEVRQQYRQVLVDEFQDINRASGVLLRYLVGEERRVWVVGDANQAIYGFRGASPANIANFHLDYPGAAVLPLSRNYRSRPDIVGLADAFRYSKLELEVPEDQRQLNQAARSNADLPYITLATAESENSEFSWIVKDMRERLKQGYNYRDLVVLCRTRSQARKISRTLSLAGLPLVERGDMLEQEYILDLISILLLFCETSGMGILRAAHFPEHPLTQEDIEALLKGSHQKEVPLLELMRSGDYSSQMSEQGRYSLRRIVNIFRGLEGRANNVWMLLASYLLIETETVRRLLLRRSSEDPIEAAQSNTMLGDYAVFLDLARLYDQRQAAILWQEQNEAEERGEEVPQPPKIIEQVRGFLDYLNVVISLRQDTTNRQQAVEQAESEEIPNIIRVMTVHASKGLEFPVVYLPGIAQNRFPSVYRGGRDIQAPAGMLSEESQGKDLHESNEANLFYVGITRAKDRLIVSYSSRYGKLNYKASTYLEALTSGLPEDRVQRISWPEDSESLALQALKQAEDESVELTQPNEGFIDAMTHGWLNNAAIGTYLICPRRFAYNNIYRFKREEGQYQRFWQAADKTMEKIQTEQSRVNEITHEQIQEQFLAHWQDLGGQEHPFAGMYEKHGEQVTGHIWRSMHEVKGYEWSMHHSIPIQIEGRTVQVDVDRVLKAKDPGETVTFVRTRLGKTKNVPAPEEREWLYQRAYEQQYPDQEPKLLNHNLSTNELSSIKIGSKKEKTLERNVIQAIEGIEGHQYPARPESENSCPNCPFFLICPV